LLDSPSERRLAVGQAWASGSVGPEIEYVEGGDAKAFISDAKPAPTLAVADAATGAGGGSFTLGGAMTAAKDQLMPLTGSSPWIDRTIAALIIGGLVVAAGSYAYRWYANRRKQERLDALDLQTKAPA